MNIHNSAIHRREFLLGALAAPAAGLFTLGRALPGEDEARILIILQLTGGNDGLNTCPPVDDDRYHRARPQLRVAAGAALKAAENVYFHPELSDFVEIYKNGALAVIPNTGYPRPDRSHFRSMEIWHSASTDPAALTTGWAGRAADLLYLQKSGAPALHVGSTEQPLALAAERSIAPSILDIQRAMLRPAGADTTEIPSWLTAGAAPRRESAPFEWMAGEARAACDLARKIRAASQMRDTKIRYPDYPLAKKLLTIGQLISAGYPANIYYLELDGFDTHAGQAPAHAALLRELGSSLRAFAADLRARGAHRRVATMIFSEFGRRLRENASGGTDHGAAAPMFVMGESVRGGFHGSAPDLEHLDDGDVTMKTDFRAVYASVIRDWLALDAAAVLGPGFEGLRLFA